MKALGIVFCIVMVCSALAASELNPLQEIGDIYWGISADTLSNRYEDSVIDFNDIAIVCNGTYQEFPAYITYIFYEEGLSMVTFNLQITGEDRDQFFTAYQHIYSHLKNSYGRPIEDQEIGTDIANEQVYNEISSGQRQISSFWVVGDTRLILSLKKSRLSEYPVSVVVLYSHNQ